VDLGAGLDTRGCRLARAAPTPYAQNMRGWPAMPANLSPGFYVRGTGITSHAFGQLSSPGTFGGIGTNGQRRGP
ncbi:hypothetical protein RA989_21735, partial [Mycobacteroides abscessus subsp. massiliense]